MGKRDEKIFPALPQKRQRAREQGQIARSRDLTSAIAFGGAALIAITTLGRVADLIVGAFRDAAAVSGSGETAHALAATLMTPLIGVGALATLLALIALCGASLQGGIVFTPGRIAPDLNRINPAGYFGRIFALGGLSELAKAALKIVLIAVIAWQTARAALAAGLRAHDVPSGLAVMRAAVTHLLGWSALIALIAGAVDYAYQRYQHETELRMTRQEFLDELKQEEGNPQIKRAIRRAMRKGAKRIRGIHQAATATVVLTNPTHYAVALRYRRGFDQAPLVVAKGAGESAHRIVAIARMAAVPVRENKPLARALFRHVEVGEHIPRHFYRAVAEVLGMIMRAHAAGQLTSPVAG